MCFESDAVFQVGWPCSLTALYNVINDNHMPDTAVPLLVGSPFSNGIMGYKIYARLSLSVWLPVSFLWFGSS